MDPIGYPGVQRPAKKGDLKGLEYEILQEKAAALNRLGQRLESSLRALAEFDASAAAPRSDERIALLRQAGEALWYFAVQREACGLRDLEPVLTELGVPPEVHRYMGYYPRSRP